MLARFAESFNDYAMLMYSINYNEKTEEKISFSELTEAKIRTLSQYDILSSQRGKAYNYFPQNDDFTIAVSALWDTDNVSGLEKKVSFLTGIKDYTRRFLYCIKNDETDSMEEVVVEGNTDECNDPVGMHLIEHILLRPRDAAFAPMQGCDDGCDCRCESEPYSFRASVVLPYWPGHFDNMAFRQYFENKIREEAPAHIMLKICWLNNELMREFEVKYKLWIETLASYAADQKSGLNAFRKANDSMVDILSRLHSEYPKATLHNCNENKDGRNPVVLGKTVLGTFKNS
jgi:hypothetical protein